MKVLRWLLVFTPFLPLVIFTIPHAMTFMPEPWDPWYTKYTTPVWFVCALYVYPVTGFLHLFGIQALSDIHIFGMIVYASALAAAAYWFLFGKSSNNAPKPTGPRRGPAT